MIGRKVFSGLGSSQRFVATVQGAYAGSLHPTILACFLAPVYLNQMLLLGSAMPYLRFGVERAPDEL